jgi:hypothetical protein
MTRTSGAANVILPGRRWKTYCLLERSVGEYELWLMEADKENAAKKLTDYGAGYRYRPFWSPDSKKIALSIKPCG